jgi:hypothetical protein
LIVGPGALSGERRLADRDKQVITDRSDKHFILILKPSKLCLKITYSLLQAAHL